MVSAVMQFINKQCQTIRNLYRENSKTGFVLIFKSQSQVYYRPKCERQNKKNIAMEISLEIWSINVLKHQKEAQLKENFIFDIIKVKNFYSSKDTLISDKGNNRVGEKWAKDLNRHFKNS